MRISDWSSDVCSSDLLAAITVASKQPIQAALRVLPSAMFGASAYGLVPTKTSIEAITRDDLAAAQRWWMPQTARSDEHTSELQSLMSILYAVFFFKNIQNHNQ